MRSRRGSVKNVDLFDAGAKVKYETTNINGDVVESKEGIIKSRNGDSLSIVWDNSDPYDIPTLFARPWKGLSLIKASSEASVDKLVSNIEGVSTTALLASKKNAAGSNNKSLSTCLLYTSPSPRDRTRSRMPSSA